MKDATATERVAVVAVPFPAQGHLNQMLHLSLQLASRGGLELEVHYAAPEQHVRQARARVHGWGDEALRSIHFYDLGISSYISPPPDPTADSPFPSHLMPLYEAYTASARAPLAALLDTLSGSRRRVVVVHDRINAFAIQEAARLPNGEAFGLHCLALSMLVGQADPDHRVLRDNGLVFSGVEQYATEEFLEYRRRARPSKQISPGAGVLTNTCRAIEGEFIDVVAAHLAGDGKKKLFAIGPLNPLVAPAAAPKRSPHAHECLDWLDQQPPASVLYVSFGTSSTLPAEQIQELAAALRDSKQRFIWVLRDADRGDIFMAEDGGESRRHEKLLPEFTQGTGMVITGWAPQLEILAHRATAAFMSHCGWNSTMESLSHGKPILAWPMHCDQPWDAQLVCNYLKAGILVRPWEKHGEVIAANAIQRVIEDAMLSDKGMEVRRRAMALGDSVRASMADGGPSSKSQDDFIAYITSR
nr:UGT93B8 [Avena strigosa]